MSDSEADTVEARVRRHPPVVVVDVTRSGLGVSETRLMQILAEYVKLAGDEMHGPLLLVRDPEEPMEASTRRFTLTHPVDGGTF